MDLGSRTRTFPLCCGERRPPSPCTSSSRRVLLLLRERLTTTDDDLPTPADPLTYPLLSQQHTYSDFLSYDTCPCGLNAEPRRIIRFLPFKAQPLSMHLRWSDLLCLHHWCQVDWFKLPKTIEIFSLQLLLFSTPYHLFSALLNFSLHRDSQLFYLPYPTPTGVRSYSAVTDFWSLQIADFWSLQIITLAALVLWLLSLTVRLRFR